MSKRRLLKLFAVLAVVVASIGASRSPAVADSSPCHMVGFCMVCHASNQDCVVIFCPNGLYSDCEFV